MKRAGFVLMTAVITALSGCATKGYVNTRTDPLVERLNKLEAKVSELNAMRETDSAAIRQANDKAQQALDVAGKTSVDAVNANNEVRKIEATAMRADTAATRAEKAANEAAQAAGSAREMAIKSEKAFNLGQKK